MLIASFFFDGFAVTINLRDKHMKLFSHTTRQLTQDQTDNIYTHHHYLQLDSFIVHGNSRAEDREMRVCLKIKEIYGRRAEEI